MTQAEFEERIIGMQDTLYRVSTTILRRLCDREDAVQSTIEKALCKRDKLRNDDAMQKWVIRILINECNTLYRRRKHETLLEIMPERETASDANPDLYCLFTSLDEKHRLCMVLHYVEGYDIADVARILHLPKGTVKSRLHYGRTVLKEALETKEVTYEFAKTQANVWLDTQTL